MHTALTLITFRQWQRHKLRLALTILGIVLGVAVFFAVQTANANLVGSLHSTIEKLAGKATLQVVGGEAGFSQNVLQQIRSTSGVQIAEPVTETIADISGGEKLLVLGLDTSSDLALYSEMFDQAGIEVKNPLAFTSRPDSIAVTHEFAARHNLKENDKLIVETPGGKRDFTIRGFFKTAGAGSVFDGNVAALDLSAAQDAFNRGEKIDRIDIMIAPDATTESVQQALRSQLPGGIDAVHPDLRGQTLEKAVTTMHLLLTMISFLALFIGVFIIFNSFSVNLNQRRREIGILRSLGVERGNVQKMIFLEAILIGLIGSSLGIWVGFYLAQIAEKIMNSISVSVYGYVSSPQPVSFDLSDALLAFGIGIAASVIAAWLPARIASKLNPVSALSNVENQARETQTGKLRIFIGITSIIAGFALVLLTNPGVGFNGQFAYCFLVLLGMILLLPNFIGWGARILRPVMDYLFGVEGVIAVETMARSPRRTSATVGALMVGLTLVFAIGAAIQSQKDAINRSLDKSFNSDFLITSSNQLHSRTYHFSETVADRIASLPGIEKVDQTRTTAINYEGEEVALLAHDMDAYFSMSPDLLDEGNTEQARQMTARGDGVLISNNFARRWNIKAGDTIKLGTPHGTLQLPVAGLLEYYRSEKGTIFLERALYKKYWDDDSVDYILINLENNADRAAFKNSVYQILPEGQNAFVYTHEEYKKFVTKLIDQFFTMTYLQMVIAVMVGALGLMNTMIVSVAERRREIGIVRAIGGLRGQVAGMVLLEAVSISLIGMVTGLFAGVMVAYFLIHTAAKIIAGFNLSFRFPFVMVVVALPIVIVIALLSAWLPARKAARLPVAEAIGYE